jgi:hypothetical protein
MKKLIAISAIAAMATTGFANDDLAAQLEALKAQIQKLEAQIKQNEKAVKKNTKNIKKAKKTATDAKILANNDNLKFDVDFRTAMDSIHYKHVSGKKSSNPDMLTTRLWLGMGYAPSDNVLFKGVLGYNKAFGDTMNHSQSNTQPGYANFDWITNENATDNTLKVKEAYWLYMNDTLAGTQVPWTFSIGRRPSTDGLGINLREGQKRKSPLSHTVNVEFDGASAKFTLSKVTGVDGMWFKLCTGRGLTNAKARFQSDGADYAADNSGSHTEDINMYGFIFVPWDNGQYSVHTNWARAENLIGFDNASMQAYGAVANNMDPENSYAGFATTYDQYVALQKYAPQFKNFGDMDMFTVMAKAEGIGDGISDYLDDTKVFASWAQSKTHPKANMSMLGSTESKTGHSTWIGVDLPCPVTDDGRFGVEWNKGNKYWRSVTYGEDTMIGSKIAARGTAWEVYYNKPLTKALYFNARYTMIDYEYTGSNSFFGDDGAPITMAQAKAAAAAGTGADVVEEANDLRLSISYRF